MPLPTGYLPAG